MKQSSNGTGPGLVLLLVVGFVTAHDSCGQENSDPPARSIVQSDVPQGRIDGPHDFHSELFPGTVRQYWIYVPTQYDPEQPPGLMIDSENRTETNSHLPAGWEERPGYLRRKLVARESGDALGTAVRRLRCPTPMG